MSSPDYLAPYHEAVREHGPTFRATLWTSAEKQVERFRVISGMHDLSGKRILDVGAGLGDLAAYLIKRRVRYAQYLGIEGVPEMAEEAGRRRLKRAAFRCADFVNDPGVFIEPFDGEAADVIVFSGSLNTFSEEDARGVLARAWEGTGEALIFNFLSTRRTAEGDPPPPPPEPGDPARRFDPLAMLDWALTLTPRVRFGQDYFDGHDATIKMAR